MRTPCIGPIGKLANNIDDSSFGPLRHTAPVHHTKVRTVRSRAGGSRGVPLSGSAAAVLVDGGYCVHYYVSYPSGMRVLVAILQCADCSTVRQTTTQHTVREQQSANDEVTLLCPRSGKRPQAKVTYTEALGRPLVHRIWRWCVRKRKRLLALLLDGLVLPPWPPLTVL